MHSSQVAEISNSFRSDLEETETEFSVFYENVLKCLYRIPRLEFDKLRQSLGNIRSYRNPDLEVYGVVDFEEKYDRCGYVFAYSIINSIVTYDRFSDVLKHNPSMLEKIVRMKNLRLCILGGGPAFEVAAICKLLIRVFSQLGPDERPPLLVNVTVIDKCADWETEAKHVVNTVQDVFCTGNSIKVDFNFIEADLVEDFTPDAVRAFKTAHFVTMVKFISDVNDTYTEKKVIRVINKIYESMNSKSCLFFLDTSGGGLFQKTDRMINKFPCMSRIYGPSLHYCYKLSLNTVESFPGRMRAIFKYLKCTSQTKISCSAWLKTNFLKLEELSSGIHVDTPASVLEDIQERKCKDKQRKLKIKQVMQSHIKKGENDFSHFLPSPTSMRMHVENPSLNVVLDESDSD